VFYISQAVVVVGSIKDRDRATQQEEAAVVVVAEQLMEQISPGQLIQEVVAVVAAVVALIVNSTVLLAVRVLLSYNIRYKNYLGKYIL